MNETVALPPINAEPEDISKALFPPRTQTATVLDRVRNARNVAWARNPVIPSWVNPETVDLDRFFTRPGIARKCHEDFLRIMTEDNADQSHYNFVDPSAGDGAFYDLLPNDRRVGVELVPGRSEFVCRDFLGWKPPMNRQRPCNRPPALCKGRTWA